MKSHYHALAIILVSFVMGCGDRPTADRNPPANDTGDPKPPADQDETTKPSQPSIRSSKPETPQESRNLAGKQLDSVLIARLLANRDLDQAESLISAHLVSNPNDSTAIFQLAQVFAAKGDFAHAIELLDEPVVRTSSTASLPALGQSAAWCLELAHYDEAESRYRELLLAAPHADIAQRAFAELMLRMGRGHAAVSALHRLCRSGNIKQSELAALIAVGEANTDPAIDPYAKARRLAQAKEYARAIEQLGTVIDAPDSKPDVQAFYLRLLAETQQYSLLSSRLAHYADRTANSMRQHADYWAALGALALANKEADFATSALLRALSIDSTDGTSLHRLRQAILLSNAGSPKERILWDSTLETRYRSHHESVVVSNRIAAQTANGTDTTKTADSMDELAGLLETMGRRIEAVLWQSIAAQQRGAARDVVNSLQKKFKRLASSTDAFPTAQERRFGIPENLFTNLNLSPTEVSISSREPLTADDNWPAPAEASWRNISNQIELNHQFLVGEKPQRNGFAIYQTVGGGVAALDFDRDGRCDLFFAQGAADAPNFRSETFSPLFRNLGQRVANVTQSSNVTDNAYAVGVSAGDWNQDGFDDLVVNAFGKVAVMTNNGDGTFRSNTVHSNEMTRMPASIAFADANADGWLDLIALGYAEKETVWLKPPLDKQGRPTQSIGPSNFAGAENLFIPGTETGFDEAGGLRDDNPAPGRSFGVVVAPLLGSVYANDACVNQIFIGNDQQNNRLWTATQTGWTESAMIHGCAYGSYGNATAAMGIATGDLNQDGFLDMHITNYQDEPVSLYMGGANGLNDQTVRMGLHRETDAVLGFGSVSIDYDLNGLPDLMVTNGHIDDTTENDEPFAQPMQLFTISEGRYENVDVADDSGYWHKMHVGRAMAKLDFNLDGREDVVLTNLNEPCALLLNETATKHHWLRLELIGTESARHPVGARVEIEASRTLHHTIVAGDGYLCRNEPTIVVGLGDHKTPVQVTVTWPNGTRQSFAGLKIDRTWQIVQGNGSPYRLTSP